MKRSADRKVWWGCRLVADEVMPICSCMPGHQRSVGFNLISKNQKKIPIKADDRPPKLAPPSPLLSLSNSPLVLRFDTVLLLDAIR
jgi:hypothetical protein